jgi:hypothetical protein
LSTDNLNNLIIDQLQVGLLAKDNDGSSLLFTPLSFLLLSLQLMTSDQIIFAYKLYRDSSLSGHALAQGFKQTFSIPDISIHFIGVFDTVSSVGMFGKKFAFDSAAHREVR